MIDNTKLVARAVCIQDMVDHLDDARNFNIVSIRCSSGLSELVTEQYKAIDDANLPNIIVVTFDDLEFDFEKDQGQLPTQEDVSKILSWAKTKWEENHKKFVVHCIAGIGRSPAISMLINEMILGNGISAFDPDIHLPNRRILNFGETHLGISGLKDKAWKILTAWKEVKAGKDLF